MQNIFIDSETCGLHGPIVLLQYTINDGPIILVDVWKKTIKEIINFYESFLESNKCLIFFNASFDFFHIVQQWTVLQLMDDKNKKLEDCVEEYANKEGEGRFYPYCMKPYHTFDIMLHARKTKYQSTMERSDIKIRRIPTILAQKLADELNKRIKLSSIYFAKRKKDREIPWRVYPTKDPQFQDVTLKFAASSGLKALAIDALGIDPDETLYYNDIGVPKYLLPYELGYAPFYGAISRKHQHEAWPNKIRQYISHWAKNSDAREYARRDVEYTRRLYDYFQENSTEILMDDDDSILACLVAVVRWKGFAIDLPKIKVLRDKKRLLVNTTEFDPNHIPTAPKQVLRYITDVMDSPAEKAMFLSRGSTNKIVLQGLIKDYKDHPVAKRADNVLQARDAKYQIDFYNKLIRAGRLHADLKVIGTLSSRMSGTSQLNATGIKRTKEVRSCFPLADKGYILCGGDFESHEVALAAAKYNDPLLTKDLLTCWKCKYLYKPEELLAKKCPQCGEKDSRQKVHGLFGMELFPGNNYEQILASKGTAHDMYGLSKNGVFSMVYGGDWTTLVRKYGISEEVARRAEIGFGRRYPNVKKARERTKARFQSMSQPNGIGSQVIWRDPDEYIESMLGFRRYFTLENMICKALFELANNPPKAWRDLKIPIVRRDRIQMVGGAVQSALYGAAFGIQGAAMRAAENHTIQSAGSQINKRLETAIWELQPKGIHEWIVQPLNVHDELMIPTKPEYEKQVREIVKSTIESYRPLVPLIAFDYKSDMKSWADK